MGHAAVRPSLWNFTELKRMFVRSYAEFNEDQAPRLGAALAYYTTLSLAPLLILLIGLAGVVFGEEAARGQLFNQIRDMVGTEGARTIEDMVRNAAKPANGLIASSMGLITLLYGASSIASELRISLNTIWDQPQDPNEGIATMVKERSYALAVVLGCGFLLVVSLAVSSVVAVAGKVAAGWLPFSEPMLHVLDLIISIVVLTGVFAALFKYLPDIKVRWRDVLPGAAVTAILFTLGKFLIGMYLGKASFGSTYGAAGSLVIVLVWVYYSAQIFFLGAEFTQVYACERGSEAMCDRRDRRLKGEPRAAGKALKVPEVSKAYTRSAAHGNTMDASTGQAGAAGWLGLALGSLLAGSKMKGVLKK
jgi:membrane protein